LNAALLFSLRETCYDHPVPSGGAFRHRKGRRNGMTQNGSEGLGPEGSYYEAMEQKQKEEKRRKQDALFPIEITALYLVLGAVFHLWHPGWLIFLTIPLHYMRPKNRLEQLCNPIMVTLIYLILGFFFHLWHPGWLVFLAIPLGAAANK
jgi:multidrug efflux pump subunit AcrB